MFTTGLLLRKYAWLGCLLLLAGGWLQPGQAYGQSASIDSLRNRIKPLLQAKQYGAAADVYVRLGGMYQTLYGYNKHSIGCYFNSLNYAQRAGDSTAYYNTHLIIGDYYSQDPFLQSNAEQHLNKALTYFARIQNMAKVIECRLAIANMRQRREPMAKNLITELRKTEQMCSQYHETYFQAYALNLLATTYLRSKRPDSAQYFANRSLTMATKLDTKWLIALNHFYLGIVDQFRDRSQEAIASYKKSYEIAESQKNITMMQELSKHTADSYSRLGNYQQAYVFALKAMDFTNQFYNSEQTKSIRLHELNNRISTLAVEKKLIEEQNRHQHTLNMVLIAVLIISVFGVIALFLLRGQQKLITHQQTVIAQQQIKELELKSLRAMIEGQEGERSRIARDLHDGLGIQLSRIKLFVEAHQELLPLSVKDPLNQFLDDACVETRLISNDLRPYALSMFGLIPALEDLVQKLNLVNETRLFLEHYGQLPVLGDEASVMIYRVIQELLNNALKHAHARFITVQVMTDEERALISVEDDGLGGDFENTFHSGNGIINVKTRIAYLGGQVIWQSRPEKGTSVLISLPMQRLTKGDTPPVYADPAPAHEPLAVSTA
ncbi:ATP-binding protein [Spirosoma utsteinense]|uniref:ATP-binding protein n=1 Tax=Spirosoma utsteinense TaxID=2585773 RepID=UPI00164412F8|nr:ATP-binding protein [Spirosoma utsteinense]MBC3786852.1 signal transduction histidine kinase [Spirosoma utsteinense]